MERLHRYPDLLASGVSREVIRQRVGDRDLHRIVRGVYGRATKPPDRLRALFLRLPDGAVAGFSTAAELHGFGVPGGDSVHVIIPAGTVVPRISGVVTHEAVLPVQNPVELAGVPCAPAPRCAIDLARHLHRMDALPLLDAALRSGSCRPEELRAEVARHGGLRGVCQARDLVPLADPRAECRQESQLRLVLLDGGLPAPEPQIWVMDSWGIPLYRLDLGYRKRRVGLEYDGVSHLDRDRLRNDRARSNWLAANGWNMRHFTDRDLYRRPEHIVRTVWTLLR